MFDDHGLIEAPELRSLRDALAGVALPARPPLETVTRRRRGRRPGAVGATAAALGMVVVLAFAGAVGREGAHPASRASAPAAIRTPAYALVSDTRGRVRLTINPRRLFRPARLQRDLARFGIPALVTSGRFCTSDPEPAGLSRVVSIGTGRRQTITFHRSAIPAGTELSVGRLPLRFGALAEVALIDRRGHTCSSAVPTGPAAAGTRVGYFGLPAAAAP